MDYITASRIFEELMEDVSEGCQVQALEVAIEVLQGTIREGDDLK